MTEFRSMRRKRQLLPQEESIKILENATAGTLALLGDGGYPYSLPISYVYRDGSLFFHSALKGHKVDAIRGCEKASFSVIERDDVKPREFTTYFRSVVCFGRIHIIEDDEEKMGCLAQAGRTLQSWRRGGVPPGSEERLRAHADDSPRHRTHDRKRSHRTRQGKARRGQRIRLSLQITAAGTAGKDRKGYQNFISAEIFTAKSSDFKNILLLLHP